MDDSQQKKPGRPSRQKITEIEAPKTEFTETVTQEPGHLVIINGVERRISKMTFEVLSKNPDFKIELPEGTELIEPKVTPCKNC